MLYGCLGAMVWPDRQLAWVTYLVLGSVLFALRLSSLGLALLACIAASFVRKHGVEKEWR